jgi:hypothetical protein
MLDQVYQVYLEAYSKYLIAIFDTARELDFGHPSALLGDICP